MTLVIIRAAALVGLGILAAPPLVALLIRYAFQSAHTAEGQGARVLTRLAPPLPVVQATVWTPPGLILPEMDRKQSRA